MLFILYLLIQVLLHPPDVREITLSDFAGAWKDIDQTAVRAENTSLRIYFFNADSTLSLIQYEPGTRSRVWMNVGDIQLKDHILYYDEFSAQFNSTKDTLTVNYHDPSGNTYPFYLTRVQDPETRNFLQGFVRSLNPTYTYKKPDQREDGWRVEDMRNMEIDQKLLQTLMLEILQGTYHDIHSLLVIKDNRIVLEEYFARRGKLYGDFIHQLYQNKLHHLASISKPVTSLLTGCALEKGFINSIQDPIFNYFPEYPQLRSSAKRSILLKHLLTMTSGLRWRQFGLPFQHPENDARIMYQAEDVLDYYFSRPLQSKPGKRFNYSNASATAMGALLEHAGQMNLDQLSESCLFEPLGIRDFKWDKYPDGTYDADGGLALTERDLAKIGQLILNKGSWNNTQVITSDWISNSTAKKLNRSSTFGYGYYWQQTEFSIDQKNYSSILAWGDGGQFLFIFPDLNLVVVSTAGNYGKGQDQVIFEILNQYLLPAVQP